MVSLAGGSQEGTYTAHPQHMRVRLPRNIDDEILDHGDEREDLPLTQPSPTNYPLHRIRLAEITRHVVDTLHFGISDISEHDYDQIMALDKRVGHFLEDLPVFFKLDHDSLEKSKFILEQYPYFAMQRYLVNISAHSVRCKLHQPFLVRNSEGSKYAQSVKICLSSAMEVIKINQGIREDPTHSIPKKVKLVGLLHHTFLATIVLVMDLCFNRIQGNEDTRSADVASAIKMLEGAKHESVSVQRFLDSLMEALSKHQIRLVDSTVAGQGSSMSQSQPQWSQHWRNPSVQSGQPPTQDPQMATLGTDYLWKDGLDNVDMSNMPDWEQLFADLDTFIV